MRCISIVRSFYFRIFSASFLITFLSPEIATPINIHVPFSLSRIMSGLLLGLVLSVCICLSHNMVTLPPWLVSTDFGTCSYKCFFVQLCFIQLLLLCCHHHHHHHYSHHSTIYHRSYFTVALHYCKKFIKHFLSTARNCTISEFLRNQ